jgi:hypothetical protein
MKVPLLRLCEGPLNRSETHMSRVRRLVRPRFPLLAAALLLLNGLVFASGARSEEAEP